MSLPPIRRQTVLTISALGLAVREHRMNAFAAAEQAMLRRDLGLCDECDQPFDGDPEFHRGLCRACYAREHEDE